MKRSTSRTRPGKLFPGPSEVKMLREATSTYRAMLQDAKGVIEDTIDRLPREAEVEYARLLLNMAAAAGTLVKVEASCARLLGEA
jgi:hypothetical protein